MRQVDLGNLYLLCAVATQGNPRGTRDHVKRYKLQYSSDGVVKQAIACANNVCKAEN